jgi:predicted acylesterase/phospholipase RssA
LAIPQWELIWVSASPGLAVPLEALTRLLAAAAAQQFGCPTYVVLVGTSEYTRWTGGIFTNPVPTTFPLSIATFSASFARIFVVNDANPNVLPPGLTNNFHRIVYVTETPPKAVPPALAGRLQPGAVNPGDRSQTYFSSFIPSIILPGPAPQPPRGDAPPLGSLLSDIVHDAFTLVPTPIRQWLGCPPERDFHSEPLDDEVSMTTRGIIARPRSRLERDACRLRLDLAEVGRLWTLAKATNTVNYFHHTVLLAHPAYRSTTNRWARAVTNRRIGVAVNGYGASSYRLVPVFEGLEAQGVPVDVMGGVSGGASLGAYFCRDGTAGLATFQGAGNLLSIAGLLVAGVSSQPIESGLDWALRNTKLDDLEVRFVPVTTALKEIGEPEAHAVVRGTLGAAVRASGAFPGLFARTVKHEIVYSDGAMSAQIPSRALCDYGADFVFAFNSVPGPGFRNPLRSWPGGELLYRFTLLGPLLDMLVSNSFMMRRIGREAGLWAHEFIEMTPTPESVLEIFRWDKAAQLVQNARLDSAVATGVLRCATFWLTVRTD